MSTSDHNTLAPGAPFYSAGSGSPSDETAAASEEPLTRPRQSWWDRIKILLLLSVIWVLLVWSQVTNVPVEPWGTAALNQVTSAWWLLVLIGLELVRQVHYFVSEHSAGWHHLWSDRVFGWVGRRSSHLDDWTRYRIGRVVRVVVALVVLAVILGAFFHTSPLVSLFQVPAELYSALPFILQLAFAFFFIAFQFIGLFWILSRGGVDVYFPGEVKTRFKDVWGQDAVLERVKENIVFLKEPDVIEARGGFVPGGILLWGPPGTGKTLMAEAVAGETENPFVFVDPGAFQNMFFGVGILKVKSLFRKLRKLALRYGGVVVFFDEADSLGNRGGVMPAPQPFASGSHGVGRVAFGGCNGMSWIDPGTASLVLRDMMPPDEEPHPRRLRQGIMAGMGGMGGGGMGTLQALLSELSGLKKPRGFINRTVRRFMGMEPKPPPKYRILVMMATNRPDTLDEALLRPGRIDRIYKVGYPSKAGRVRTYEGYFEKVNHELTDEQIDRLATITPYATGATIKDLVNESLINAIRGDREVITWQDVVKAKQLKELGPPEDVEYIERERHAVAVHEACHAVTAVKVRHHLTIDVATIEKGGTYLGMVAAIPPEDQFTHWRSDYESDIIVSLASLVGERMFFEGDSSSGVSGDLEAATRVATYMEGFWGMGDSFASHGVTHQVGVAGGGKPGGKHEGHEDHNGGGALGERIEVKLGELSARAGQILSENRSVVLGVAYALESHKTVTGEDVVAIVNGQRGPLIDGRPYHDPRFRAALEDYHQSVVTAHHQHGPVLAPLPPLPRLPIGDGSEAPIPFS
ncbi:MAG: AAA family ATPase [Acidimicrobiales bacterium]|nr:AAA family ATPase [Acidimicrobiales bacterium]